MSLSIAIVGLPNVGKSTLFNALLKQQVALAANYPFATIEPNVGAVEVPDARLKILAGIVKTSVIKPAIVEFIDIAGLIKGASQGEGLGNKFLANIRETAAICHVLRDFPDSSILREGAVNPKDDLAVVRTELQLADLDTLSKQKPPKGKVEKVDTQKFEIIEMFKKRLEAGENALNFNKLDFDDEHSKFELQIGKELCLLTAKPEIFAINASETDVAKKQSDIATYAQLLDVESKQIVIISAKVESELSALSIDDQKMFLDDLGLKQSGLERLASVAYATLGLQSFLTAGEIEVRAWTIRKGAKAPQAAAVIHTDFEKKFIKANIVSYDDFVACGGVIKAKETGKLRQEGKEYVMQEGDVVEFMIGK